MNERTRVLVLASAVLFVCAQVWFSYSALLPLIVAEWNLSGTRAGMVFSAFQVAYVLCILPVGLLADRYPARRVVALGGTGCGLATLGFALWARGFWSALLFRFLAGVGMAGVYVPGMKMLTEWFPGRKRGTAIGVYVGSFTSSTGVSYFLSSLIAARLGWRAGIGLTSVGALFSAPLILGFTRDRPGSRSGTGSLDWSLVRNTAFLWGVGVYCGHSWELFGVRNWIQAFLVDTPALRDRPGTVALAGTLVGAMMLAGGAGNVVSGWLSDRVGRVATMGCALGGSALISLCLGALTELGFLSLAGLMVVYGTVLTADSAPISTAITERVRGDQVGTALAIQSLLGFSATAVSPIVFGMAFDWGGYEWAFPTLAAGALFGLVALCGLRYADRGTAGEAEPDA